MEKHAVDLFGGGQPILLTANLVSISGENQIVLVAGRHIYYEHVGSTGIVSEGTYVDSGITTLSIDGRMCFAHLGDAIYIADSGSASPYYYDQTSGLGPHGNPPADPLGDVPTSCNVVANVGERLVYAGDREAGRTYYMSRVGTPNDFAYGDTDDDRALTGDLALSGGNNDGITAVIPWYSDYSLWCTKASMTLLIGDNPATGAYFYPVSQRLGCLDAVSWCRGPGQRLFIVGRDGMAICDPGAPRNEPKVYSVEKMPRELLAIDPDSYRVTPIWDSRAKGVHIFVTKETATSGLDHWFWSEEGKGFFRMQYPTNCEPFSACAYPPLTSQGTNILLGCRDGRLRKFTLTSNTDDGTNFDSHVFLGPIRPGGDDFTDGKVVELIGVMSEDSSSVDVDIYAGQTPEEAAASTSAWNNSLSSGRSSVHRPRTRAGDAYVKITGTPGDDWGMEKVILKTSPGGRQR